MTELTRATQSGDIRTGVGPDLLISSGYLGYIPDLSGGRKDAGLPVRIRFPPAASQQRTARRLETAVGEDRRAKLPLWHERRKSADAGQRQTGRSPAHRARFRSGLSGPARAGCLEEGLIGSVIRLLGLDLAIPDHSTLSRRAETLAVAGPPSSTEPCICWWTALG
jgi:hypothetical protein